MIKACDAHGVDLAWTDVSFAGEIPPVSRSFTELAGQALDRIPRKCAPSISRTWFVISQIGRLLSQAAGAGDTGYVSERRPHTGGTADEI